VQSSLEAGVAYTSVDINVTYLRPVTKDRPDPGHRPA
jgi:acyl-coenzyme A thioesterase PaaI-like protein